MLVFFFNDTATTEIYTLSLHDALPIFAGFHRRLRRSLQALWLAFPDGAFLGGAAGAVRLRVPAGGRPRLARAPGRILRRDRKSTRLNSSHANISYAVFCLKKKTLTIYT